MLQKLTFTPRGFVLLITQACLLLPFLHCSRCRVEEINELNLQGVVTLAPREIDSTIATIG